MGILSFLVLGDGETQPWAKTQQQIQNTEDNEEEKIQLNSSES